ncbi:pyrophosphatase PpaX [Exiguobacterium flavidum]|uniref:pyrophosphatase PpaX n=1 Tax=Exiguobacterium flavidum TaxID=2184695 RepID=UPI000DF84707|nr:pyrophosphatase PpaX [Exiguobacterium flavidum]
MITTLLFDLDGTLIDTNPLILKSFEHTLGYYYPDRTFSHEELLPFIGPTLEKSFSEMDAELWREMVAFYRSYNIAMHDELVLEYPGVLDGLRDLKERGYKLAIVTSKSGRVARKGLELFGLTPLFDAVIAADDVTMEKPATEPFEKAMALLGATPEETIMVGDNDTDIHGGKNAGLKTVAVGWAIKGRAYLEALEPDLIIDSMKDLGDWLEQQNGTAH